MGSTHSDKNWCNLHYQIKRNNIYFLDGLTLYLRKCDPPLYCERPKKLCIHSSTISEEIEGKEICLEKCWLEEKCDSIRYNKDTDKCRLQKGSCANGEMWASYDNYVDIFKLGDYRTCNLDLCNGHDYKFCERPGRQCWVGMHRYPRTPKSRKTCEDECKRDCRCEAIKYDATNSLCDWYSSCINKDFIVEDTGLLIYRIAAHETCDEFKLTCNDKKYGYTVKEKVRCPGNKLRKYTMDNLDGCKSACDKDCACKSFVWKSFVWKDGPNCWLKAGVCTDAELVPNTADYYIKVDMGPIYNTPLDAGLLLYQVEEPSCVCTLGTADGTGDLVLSNFEQVQSNVEGPGGRWIILTRIDTTSDSCPLDVQAYVYPSKPTFDWEGKVTANTVGARIGAVRFKTTEVGGDDEYNTRNTLTVFTDGQAHIEFYQNYYDYYDDSNSHEFTEEKRVAYPLNSGPTAIGKATPRSGSKGMTVERPADGSTVVRIINTYGEDCKWSVYFNKNEVAVVAPHSIYAGVSTWNDLCGSCEV